ncbi:MAG: valine--tRNA ligase [Acidobacteria bacterium]|nr:valine--tRNA ligase [Acidobacteriota bacterium]
MSESELPKRYEPETFERRWYDYWKERGLFTPDGEGEPFSIVIPPPNVTGRLHLGHALVNTLQDVLVRWKRMSGFDTLWIPGVDHAGIATQMVVEREIASEGKTRHDLGREKFLERVWQWKEEHGDAIVSQLERLGVSCDWTRSRFTLDEGLSRAVRTVFVRLFDEGLIYRDTAMINWCPRCMTAISDLEVEHRETSGSLWHIHYPLADGSGRVTVATTRPETMLGDTAVAVHPDDPRYSGHIGKTVRLPLTDREIPVIADSILVDPEFGTGVVKITPAHDRNDYEAGRRNGLPMIDVMAPDGKMNAAAGSSFEGLDRFDARKKIVEELESLGLLDQVEPQTHSVGRCSRCDSIAEPRVSTQWFVKIDPLARPAIEAVRTKRIELIPEQWENTYFAWMENIHDWCISRQLWWGHRIPAWYCSCGEMIVAVDEPEGCPSCKSGELRQDPDVLDTWFSSGLWPFSTMGWPEKTPDFERYYPTSVLVTGFDILFFWVARMIMMGLHFTGERPFEKVFLHGLVRDEHGQKMSKTKGNVIDPLEVADEFGADAVRFTLAILSTGRDIPLARSRMQGYAAFANKIWNAARFALMHLGDGAERAAGFPDAANRDVLDRWIIARLNTTTGLVNDSLDQFRFDEAANHLYHFFWHELCDWYLEMSKPVLFGKAGDERKKALAKQVLAEVLDRSVRLLHPFMPFITEEIWQKLAERESSIMVDEYPRYDASLEDGLAVRWIDAVQQITTLIRNGRVERGLSPAERVSLFVKAAGEDAAFIESHSWLLSDLAKLESVEIVDHFPGEGLKDAVGPFEISIEFPAKQVSAGQIAKLEKQIEGLEREIANTRARLSDDNFISKAPDHVVEESRRKLADYESRLETLRDNLTT